MKKLFTFLLFAFFVVQFSAQTKGKLTYSIDFTSDKPEMSAALPMMQGSGMEFFFTPDNTRANVTIGMMMTMNTIVDLKAKKGLMLMQMMGSKIATPLDLSQPSPANISNYTKVDSKPETKDVLGFKAEKAVFKDQDGNNYTVWFTKSLKPNMDRIEQLNMFKVDGLPLEFEFEAQGMKSKFTATKFEKDVDNALFSLKIPEGFQEMSEEELSNMGQ